MRKIRFPLLVRLALVASGLTGACGGQAAGAARGPIAVGSTPASTASLISVPSSAVTSAPVFFGLEAQGVGDPNPYFEDGRYYVFYLQNEGRHPWRMSSSTDLTAWSAPIEAVPVGQAGEKDYWTGSGSIIADPAGGYRVFYTGHLPGGTPQETVMVSRSGSLAGPWTKVATPHFSGWPDYDQQDFRDPFVFWNDDAKAFWLLITTRKDGQAAIGRYTSSDLDHWTASAPLYTETSPLNLEVSDLFHEGPDWFLIFSDQRDASRQTRYIKATTAAGSYSHELFDALDGRGFYAGKTAGTDRNRLLFGWVASRRGKRDDTEFVWGGDLVAHAIRRTDNGALAVDIARPIARQFATTTGRLSLGARGNGPVVRGTRITADLRVRPGDRFGIRFMRNDAAEALAQIDSNTQEARFVVGGRTADVPRIAFPASVDGRYRLDMLLDPRQGFGILYINRFRALSFRYYGLSGTVPTVYAERGLLALDGEVRTK